MLTSQQQGTPTPAQPYANQVGGHHCIMSYNGCILKPFSENEAIMYDLIPIRCPSLIPFLTEYYGCLSLSDLSRDSGQACMSDRSAALLPQPESPEKLGDCEPSACGGAKQKVAHKSQSVEALEEAKGKRRLAVASHESGKEQWLGELYRRRFNTAENSILH